MDKAQSVQWNPDANCSATASYRIGSVILHPGKVYTSLPPRVINAIIDAQSRDTFGRPIPQFVNQYGQKLVASHQGTPPPDGTQEPGEGGLAASPSPTPISDPPLSGMLDTADTVIVSRSGGELDGPGEALEVSFARRHKGSFEKAEGSDAPVIDGDPDTPRRALTGDGQPTVHHNPHRTSVA